MSPLANATLTQARIRKQVERAAYLQHHINKASAELDALKAVFKGLGDGIYHGTGHKVVVTSGPVTRLDNRLVKGILTPGEIVACSTTTISTRVLINEV